MREYSGNTRFVEKRDELDELYLEGVFAEAATYEKNHDINGAIKVLEESLGVMDDDSEIRKKISSYKGKIPVRLADLEIYEFNLGNSTHSISDSYFKVDLCLEDTFANQYPDAWRLIPHFYASDFYTREIVYLNNEGYSHFSAVLAYENCENTKGKGYIQVYADDKLVYASPAVDDETKPIQVEADLGECHKFSIRWASSISEYGKYSQLILADPKVSK